MSSFFITKSLATTKFQQNSSAASLSVNDRGAWFYDHELTDVNKEPLPSRNITLHPEDVINKPEAKREDGGALVSVRDLLSGVKRDCVGTTFMLSLPKQGSVLAG